MPPLRKRTKRPRYTEEDDDDDDDDEESYDDNDDDVEEEDESVDVDVSVSQESSGRKSRKKGGIQTTIDLEDDDDDDVVVIDEEFKDSASAKGSKPPRKQATANNGSAKGGTKSTPKKTPKKSGGTKQSSGKSPSSASNQKKSATKSPRTKKATDPTEDGSMVFKSPAEFFAENQNIAGFDNPGKALYTTIRELVENSLDACEAVDRLPEIEVAIEEYSAREFEKLQGINEHKLKDKALYKNTVLDRAESLKQQNEASSDDATPADGPEDNELTRTNSSNTKKKDVTHSTSTMQFYRITCKDNGGGMAHEKIPYMLGRVLTGSKYGVQQTRGKFGLGAKMALIWSRKSTGLPIEIYTAHAASSQSAKKKPPTQRTYCKLDIDIYKNEPRVYQHDLLANDEGHVGTQLSVFIGGQWRAYKSRVMQYFQQLAVITPYANIMFKFASDANSGKNFEYVWRRRSTQLPPPAKEVKHHPSAVNNLLVRQIIDNARKKSGSDDYTIGEVLSKEFQCIDKKLAERLLKELGAGFAPSKPAKSLTQNQIHQLTTLLTAAKFPAPDGSCLSPAGEYNLRLGILKELRPELLATYASPVAVFEGHPFIVEAGVAIGGHAASEGITVHRFANRIPLLFEGGGDVATRTAMKRINWGAYKIDYKRDKIGVFVSIVSTKIPFKGTGKEYIGDDIIEIQNCVKQAIQACCSQLRAKLARRLAAKERQQRKQALAKYIPNVANAVVGVLGEIRPANPDPAGDDDTRAALVPRCSEEERQRIVRDYKDGKLSRDALVTRLKEAIARADHFAMLDHVSTFDEENAGKKSMKQAESAGSKKRTALYIQPRRVTDVANYTQIDAPNLSIAIPPQFIGREEEQQE
eukprot:gb/GECG01000050.1/.p1 GENE.gb/GECG01000050.1/~~gb/GECG01000050.1/.p1  ORF type:complete len:865 (+),score=155.82 gb/GECG01000050.1/:1-2595(+)